MYLVNQIFIEDDDYTNKANWCNENGYYIEEIEPLEDGTRQFQIKEIPDPTDEELALQIRAHRDILLNQTDYLMMSDYPIESDRLAKVKIYRQALRDIPEQAGFPRTITWPEKP